MEQRTRAYMWTATWSASLFLEEAYQGRVEVSIVQKGLLAVPTVTFFLPISSGILGTSRRRLGPRINSHVKLAGVIMRTVVFWSLWLPSATLALVWYHGSRDDGYERLRRRSVRRLFLEGYCGNCVSEGKNY
jgi:hypothetical protein